MKKILIAAVLSSMLGCQDDVFRNDLSKILGASTVEIVSSQSTDEFGGFGEGYTLEIYELSQKTVQSFVAESSKSLPDKKEDTEAWQKKDWSKTPVDSFYKEVFIMCLNYTSGNKNLEKHLKEINAVLEKPEVYYSIYYKPDKDSPQDAQLFILDVRSRKLYLMESNI